LALLVNFPPVPQAFLPVFFRSGAAKPEVCLYRPMKFGFDRTPVPS
jgi:hypothetical protein